MSKLNLLSLKYLKVEKVFSTHYLMTLKLLQTTSYKIKLKKSLQIVYGTKFSTLFVFAILIVIEALNTVSIFVFGYSN